MSDEAITKPTLETVLERINDLRGEMGSFRTEVTDLRADVSSLRTEVTDLRTEVTSFRAEFQTLREEVSGYRTELDEFREKVEISLDRIESMTNQTRAEMLTLRLDFREFRTQFKQPA